MVEVMVTIPSQLLYAPRKESPVHIKQESGSVAEAVWILGEKKRLVPLPAIDPLTVVGVK
jgi:hypothetical protein